MQSFGFRVTVRCDFAELEELRVSKHARSPKSLLGPNPDEQKQLQLKIPRTDMCKTNNGPFLRLIRMG